MKYIICLPLKDGINYFVSFSKIQANGGTLYGWEWSLDKKQAFQFETKIAAEVLLSKMDNVQDAWIQDSI